ncbi:MAG: FAD:protein FMN transferase [Kordiimonadaceae bacterium]|nr:FAD:protein FMN transferase [Kordiimonadaceae bacterium]MDC0081370.1 FAD:protein FMN transferase [Emcibacteraceae bacterium]MBT6466257.1 FAD:protein FMN transferase [Kordiimonadaceae bacterium]MBT7545768.1 FAD:protein FMN transferase [Kordiimonadaceae bacterium]MBT7605200.1 FAD:protein FMN transferase [Kordiimonadaceae bacterium]
MINNRRRILRVMAIGAGTLIAPYSLRAAQESTELYDWNGRALGAEASIQLYSDDRNKANEILDNTQKIINKYEGMFSLYKEKSLVSQLNKFGTLSNPSPDFIKLVMLSKKFSKITNGSFDISVQPLWNVYKNHFNEEVSGVLKEKINAVLGNIGSNKISLGQKYISFDNDNMAVSFNGIAQGYITDKVSEYLSGQGFNHVLVDIGEYRANGSQKNGEPWRVGLLDPFDEVSIADVVEMRGTALATSGGYGNNFDASGQYHHLFNPQTGLSSKLYASVTVQASSATTADALSTAFSNMTQKNIKKTLRQLSNVQVRLTDQNGIIHKLQS